jgi:hypothetical protein
VLALLAYHVVNLSTVGLPDLNIVFRELDLNIVMSGIPILASFSSFRVVLSRVNIGESEYVAYLFTFVSRVHATPT